MNTEEKIRLYKRIDPEGEAAYETIYHALEHAGDFKYDYRDYLPKSAAGYSVDAALKNLDQANYDTTCAYMTAILREDHFIDGCFKDRQRKGEVARVFNRMIDLLMQSKQDFIAERTPVFFWHEYEENGCFSNWYEAPFIVGDFQYRWMEQYMMSQKAVLFHDAVTNAKILRAHTPQGCKKLGKAITPFNSKTWDRHKFTVIYEGCRAKFQQNPELKEKLLATGDALLAEASPYDQVWGIGMIKVDAEKTPEERWPGKNLLGKALMAVRDDMKDPEANLLLSVFETGNVMADGCYTSTAGDPHYLYERIIGALERTGGTPDLSILRVDDPNHYAIDMKPWYIRSRSKEEIRAVLMWYARWHDSEGWTGEDVKMAKWMVYQMIGRGELIVW